MPSQATQFESLLEAVPDALVGVDRSGQVRFANHLADSLFGYDPGELVGRPLESLVPGAVWRALQADREGDNHAPGPRPIETDLSLVGQRRDGTDFPVDISLSSTGSGDDRQVIAAVRDVTEQRRAIEQAQGLAALVEQSPDAIITMSLDGEIMTWNPAAEAIFGYTVEEVVGTRWHLLSPPRGAAQITDLLTAIGSGEPVVRRESVRIRKDGTVFPVALTASPIRDASGAVIGASTILRDLTYQTRTFESARSMIETSLDSFVAISPDGAITDANEATVRITGVPRDKLIGTPFSDYFTDPERANEIYQRVFTEGKAENYPLTIRHKNGRDTYTDVLYNASVFRDPAGAVLGVFAAARDMTEQRKAAQYARSLIEAALDPMVTISPEGEITDVNEATVKVTGVPRDELIGTSFSDYFTDPRKANEGYQLVFEQGAVTDYPLTLRQRNGRGHNNGRATPTEVLYNASLYRDTDGQVLGVFASARDVTRQVQSQKEHAEQQGRELERLAELERFQRLTVGRELKMIELKKQIEYLRKHGPAGGGEQ